MSLVLVADDEPAVLEVLSQVIEDLGHEVLRARDGAEALRLARARRPQLVVTDHVMPRCSGLELCRALRRDADLADVPVILLSGVLAQGVPEAHAFLQKPFEIDTFEAVLREALAGSTPASRAPPRAAATRSAAHALEDTLADARVQLQRLERSGGHPEALATLGAQLGEMEALVRGLKGAAGGEPTELPLRPVNADLGAHLRGVLEAWRRRVPDALLELSVPWGPVPARFDPERLSQALDALLERAVGTGGRVQVRLQLSSALATIQVADAGPGVSAEELPHLFEPARSGGGSGLAAAAQILRQHGGAIRADLTGEPGCAFSVLLPRAGPSLRAG